MLDLHLRGAHPLVGLYNRGKTVTKKQRMIGILEVSVDNGVSVSLLVHHREKCCVTRRQQVSLVRKTENRLEISDNKSQKLLSKEQASSLFVFKRELHVGGIMRQCQAFASI